MDVLMRFGFSIDEIKNMMDTNEEIEAVPDKSINEIITILNNIGCNNKHIENIFYTNPFVLSRNPKELKKLIEELQKLGLIHLEIVFDSNPYLLNIGSSEIKNIIKQKEKEGLSGEQIKDYFYFSSDEIF